MKQNIIGSLVKKDMVLHFKNRFIAVITVIGVIFFIIVYLLMPKSVDETIELAIYAPGASQSFAQTEQEGFKLAAFPSEEALVEAVAEGDYVAGLYIPDNLLQNLTRGIRPTIKLYFPSETPVEMLGSIEILMKELLFFRFGQSLNVDIEENVLGTDMVGQQLAARERLRPLLAVIIILMETIGLANLITEEKEHGTFRALLVTPVSVKHLFLAKGITGVFLAFSQAVVFMVVVGGFSRHPFIILLLLLMGSLLVTGIGFLMASLAKDFMSVIALTFLFMMVLMIPAFAVIFPGPISNWIKVIPSYHIVDPIYQVSNFGVGWGDVWQNIIILLGFITLFFGIGIISLKRKTV